ncbi:hypothetical protein V490_06703 [Pseudogymnoascus sp. VKM F-3557]|nr:hypothetical protein V490_06703 [Pseudogymnoascus sp. VKM F-3557]
METIRSVFFKPDPQAQVRKCNQLIRANTRKLDRDIAQLKTVENKTKDLIRQASRRAERNPAQAKQASAETRVFARELIRARKTTSRLITSKAQLQSVSMQVSEAFATKKIEGSLRASTGIMKDVNHLIRLPELMGTMQELSRELVKAGVIEEMSADMLPEMSLDEEDEEEAESEVDKVLGEILKDKMGKAGTTPVEAAPQVPAEEEEEEEDAEEMLSQMRGRLTSVTRLVTMRVSIIAAVLVAPALIAARPVATPHAKLIFNSDTFSPPDLHGTPMPAEYTAPHHFADGVTDESLKRVMGARDKTLATPKEQIITHPYRPFAQPIKAGEHVELFDKVHPRDFGQKVRITGNTERPAHPNDHHLGQNIGTQINVRNTGNTERPTHPNDHHLGPNIGTPIKARANDYINSLPRPNSHILPPKIGTPINARAADYAENLPRPDGHILPPKIGTPINARAIDGTERLHPNDHHLGPKIGTPMNARAIDNTDGPHPNDHHLGPKIGTPINAKREEFDAADMPEELQGFEGFGELEEFNESGEFDGVEESEDSYDFDGTEEYEEYEESEEETPVDLPILSDYHPDSPDFEYPRYIPTTPGDRNSRRPGRLAGPLYPCAGPQHFNGTGFNSTINGTFFNTTINGTVFNNATNITAEATACFEKVISDYDNVTSDFDKVDNDYDDDTGDFDENSNYYDEDTNDFDEATNGYDDSEDFANDFDEATSDLEEPVESMLRRRGNQKQDVPQLVKDFEDRRQQQAEKAAKVEAAKAKESKDKASREKDINRALSGGKTGPSVVGSVPEIFEKFKNPFTGPPPFEEDREWTPDLLKNLNKPKHPLTGIQAGVEKLEPKEDPGYEWPRAPKPKDETPDPNGFSQGDGWKTDYFQNGVWAQPRVPKAHKPYWAGANPVY